ncbi:MAG: caspase family protein [Pseudomonadota bacterium]
MKNFYFFIFLFIITYNVSLAHADDRALLIGVEEYKNNIKNLPGVILDIETMRDSAQILGFKDENIKILLNEQVTLKNLTKTIKTWLIDGTSVDDRVLIYFSGHGSRIPDLNNDETDGADEVLVLYDSVVVKENQQTTLKNVLLDDEFSLYLQQIKSHDLMLLVDACNSGTIYRALSSSTEKAYGKFFNYEGMPQSDLPQTTRSHIKSLENNVPLMDIANNTVMQKADGFRFVAITAAGDDELALATKNGSIFTQGVHFYLKQAAINQQQLTPKQLIDKVALYIEEKVEQEKLGAVFQPQLAGNTQLSNKAINFVDAPLARVNWNRLEALDTSVKKLIIHSSKKKLTLGENISLDIEIPHQGYLNVITVGPDDSVFILYPNPWEVKNLVYPGVIHLPTTKMDFEIKLTEPLGKNLMLAVLTTEPVNLYHQTIKGRDKSGRMFSSLKVLARSNKTSLSQQSNKPSYLSGRLVVEVE